MIQRTIRPGFQFFSLCVFTLAAIALLGLANAPAMERIHFKRLSTNDGLSQSAVNAITQDRDGFLWFGTQDGLNRFDGDEFKIFRHDFGDTTTISDNYIWCVVSARNGDLWIGTLHGGLNRYNRSRGTFEHFEHIDTDSTSLPNNDVTCMLEDTHGTLWVGTWGGGLARLDSTRRHFISYAHRRGVRLSLPDDRVRCLWEDPQGVLWVGTWGGPARFEDREMQPINPVAQTPAAREIICIAGDRHNNIFIGTNGHGLALMAGDGSSRIASAEMQPLFSALATRSIGFVHEDQAGRYWVGTNDSGLVSWRPGDERPVGHSESASNPAGISSTQVSAVFEDERGGLWFGTNGDGIRRFDRRWERFQSYRSNPQAKNALGNGDVRAVFSDRPDRVWVGTLGGGMYLFSPQHSTFTHYETIPGRPNDVIGNKITAIASDRTGKLWMGTGGEGLLSWVPGSGKKVRYQHNQKVSASIAGDLIYAMCLDHRGMLWVGTGGGGLDRVDPLQNRFVHHMPSATDANTLSGSTVYSLFEDHIGNLWVGTWGRGLSVLDSSRTRFTRYLHDPTDSTSLSNNTVLCCFEDEAGAVWVGTQGGGLDRFDAQRRQFTHFTDKSGLPNNVVNSILSDAHGRLWISTNHGISCFDLNSGTFRNFDVRDGLQNNEFNVGASFVSNDGMMYFGGIEGLTVFHPDSIRNDPWNSPVILTSFKIFDRPVFFDRPVSEIETIDLSYAENFFSFEFVALDFFNPQKLQYRYKMDGFDRNWVNAGIRRYASYTHLDPGEYMFRASVTNDAGVWDQHGPEVHVRIVPPFWQTWWFRSGVGMLVLGVMFAIYQQRVKTLKREKKAQQEFSLQLMELQEGERKRIAGELHDSLGQDLLVIRNRALLGLKDVEVSKHTHDQLEQISTVATQAINEVREISYNLRPYQLDRLGLTKAIMSITARLVSPVKFSITADPIDEEVEKDQAIHVYRIVQEGINNILKHAGATEADVAIRVEAGVIRITISDNGKGLASEQETDGAGRHGFGLVGIAERAKVLSGTMSFDSSPGKGTLLIIVIPRRKTPT